MARKSISLKTKLASALLALGHVPYEHAKKMTRDQLISLYQFDHGMLHESGHPQRDEYWNLTPRLVKSHRDKTRQDAAIIAKGRRIREQQQLLIARRAIEDDAFEKWARMKRRNARRIKSRGFDRTRRRHLDGTVTKR